MGLKDFFRSGQRAARTAPVAEAPRLYKAKGSAEAVAAQPLMPADNEPEPLPAAALAVATSADAPASAWLTFPDDVDLIAERARKAEAERAETARKLEALSLSLLDRWNELEEELPAQSAVASRTLASDDNGAPVERLPEVSTEDVTAVVNTIPDAILTFDPQGRIVSANAGAEEMFGYAVKDLIGSPLARLLPGDAEGPAAELLAFATGAAQGRTVREWRGVRRDGALLRVEMSVGAVTVANERHGAAVVRDITARKAAEDARASLTASLQQQVAETQAALEELRSTQDKLVQSEKMASLGVLVAGIAHEINTPVGIAVTAASHLMDRMALLTEAITNGTLKKSQLLDTVATSRQSAEIVLSNLERAAELIQSFKQVAVDQTSRETRTIDLDVYLHETIHSLHPRIKATPHKVELLCPPGVSLHLAAGALSQVVSNLVLNALEHAFPNGEPGLVRVTASCDDDQVQLVVEDNGVGIAADVLPRIFDPFFTTRRGSGGSGLGLHIVYNLVTQTFGGSIAVTSEALVGARFTVRWPAVAA
ncbi:MAG: ATP-binding protein [Stagnimonas sp.]|nr:ATP-binding protein [Stagnimonas sp.]